MNKIFLTLIFLVGFLASSSSKGSISEGILIGHMVKRDLKITLTWLDKETLYTVRNQKTGKILANRLTEKKLKAKNPELFKQVKNAVATSKGTLDATAAQIKEQ